MCVFFDWFILYWYSKWCKMVWSPQSCAFPRFNKHMQQKQQFPVARCHFCEMFGEIRISPQQYHTKWSFTREFVSTWCGPQEEGSGRATSSQLKQRDPGVLPGSRKIKQKQVTANLSTFRYLKIPHYTITSKFFQKHASNSKELLGDLLPSPKKKNLGGFPSGSEPWTCRGWGKTREGFLTNEMTNERNPAPHEMYKTL